MHRLGLQIDHIRVEVRRDLTRRQANNTYVKPVALRKNRLLPCPALRPVVGDRVTNEDDCGVVKGGSTTLEAQQDQWRQNVLPAHNMCCPQSFRKPIQLQKSTPISSATV